MDNPRDVCLPLLLLQPVLIGEDAKGTITDRIRIIYRRANISNFRLKTHLFSPNQGYGSGRVNINTTAA